VVDKHPRLSADYVAAEVSHLQREIQEKQRRYRQDRPLSDLRGRTVLLVDDGMATGSTMLGAISVVRAQGAKQIIVAVPVASEEAYRRVAQQVDRVYCLATPEPFRAVGQFYEDFRQVRDEEVISWLSVG
jgi:putative phosphoribosyl transferase